MSEHWEVIYETGSHAIVRPENEEDAKAALAEQHRRAVDGELGGPTGHNAERIKRVLVYDEHPGDVPQDVSADEALARVKDLIKNLQDDNGVINLQELGSEVEARARVVSAPHESNYVMAEAKELPLDFLEGGK
jgi:hypothetical protein